MENLGNSPIEPEVGLPNFLPAQEGFPKEANVGDVFHETKLNSIFMYVGQTPTKKPIWKKTMSLGSGGIATVGTGPSLSGMALTDTGTGPMEATCSCTAEVETLKAKVAKLEKFVEALVIKDAALTAKGEKIRRNLLV